MKEILNLNSYRIFFGLVIHCLTHCQVLTLRLLISYIYMELLVKPEMLTS